MVSVSICPVDADEPPAFSLNPAPAASVLESLAPTPSDAGSPLQHADQVLLS